MEFDTVESKKQVEDIFANAERRAAEQMKREKAGLPAELLAITGGPTGPTPQGVNSHNMTPSNLHWVQSEPCENLQGKRSGGVDWLSFSFSGSFGNWERVREQLELAREASTQSGKMETWEIDGVSVRVGSRGEGKGTSYRRYVIRYGAVRIGIRDGYDADKPNVFVEFRGDACLQFGHVALLRQLDEACTKWGLTFGRSWVSRVDLCVDVVGITMAEVFTDFHQGKCITVARKYAIHGELGDNDRVGIGGEGFLSKGRGVQTLTLGAKGADCMLRMYDKMAEVAGDSGKVTAMQEVVWGGGIPESSVRIEYQIRREKLLELNISTLADLLGSMGRLTEYLTRKWFRVADDDVDRGHTERAKNAGWWSKVRGHFAAWTREHVERPAVKLIKSGTSADAMLSQALGCLQRMCAELGEIPEHAERVTALVVERVKEGFAEFREGVAEKLDVVSGLTLEQLETYFERVGGAGRMRLIAPEKQRGAPVVEAF